jgi:hypothetical protein
MILRPGGQGKVDPVSNALDGEAQTYIYNSSDPYWLEQVRLSFQLAAPGYSSRKAVGAKIPQLSHEMSPGTDLEEIG